MLLSVANSSAANFSASDGTSTSNLQMPWKSLKMTRCR